MDIPVFVEERKAAIAKWKEYNAAEKMTKEKVYRDLKKVYNQIKGGKKLIDIKTVISFGGVNAKGQPNFAIASAFWDKVHCRYFENGTVWYRKENNWKTHPGDFNISECLPKYNTGSEFSRMDLEALVPMIPPMYRPKVLTNDYFILWQVDAWKVNEPSKDPFLLKRVTKNMFVICAEWDLTDLELAIMKGRMY